ncbi:hypothetical protein Hanom_Chr04g00377011 [Helianthus anomalus]
MKESACSVMRTCQSRYAKFPYREDCSRGGIWSTDWIRVWRMETMEVVTGETWQGSESLWVRMDSDKETMKPRKFLAVGESRKRRMWSSEVMILVGVWKWWGGEMTGTFSAWGTGVMMMVCWTLWVGGDGDSGGADGAVDWWWGGFGEWGWGVGGGAAAVDAGGVVGMGMGMGGGWDVWGVIGIHGG